MSEPVYTSPITMEDITTLSKEGLQEKVKYFMIPELRTPFTRKYIEENMPIFRALLTYPDMEFEFFHACDLFGRILLEVNGPELNNKDIMELFTVEDMRTMKAVMAAVVNNEEIVAQAISLLREFKSTDEVSYFYEAGFISKDDIINNNKAIDEETRKEIALLF